MSLNTRIGEIADLYANVAVGKKYATRWIYEEYNQAIEEFKAITDRETLYKSIDYYMGNDCVTSIMTNRTSLHTKYKNKWLQAVLLGNYLELPGQTYWDAIAAPFRF